VRELDVEDAAVTSTAIVPAGSERLVDVFGATWMTTASPPNVVDVHVTTAVPSPLKALSGAAPAFFCTGGEVAVPVEGAVQIVKWVRTSAETPPAAIVPCTTYRPGAVVDALYVAVAPFALSSAVTVPSGRVSVMPVQLTDWLAVSVNEATSVTVEPSAGVAATR
jgi:hypothetical protein